MVVAQKLKEAEITEQDSLLLTRNLLRIAIFNISYIRGLFPEKYFSDKSVPALDMKIKKLMPMDAESRRLIDWMEKGVYDALQKKYLRTLMFCVCEAIEGPMIEEYAFSFSYSSADSQEVSMNVNRIGNKQGGTFKCNSTTEITPNQMRSSACKMVRTLIQLMRTLDKMPEEPLLADIKRGSIPKSEKKNSKPDARKMSQRAIPIKNERNLTGTKKKTPTSSPKTPQIISTPKLAKPKPASAVISVPKSSVKKANSSSLPKIKNPFGGENKRAGPTSLHLSLSLGSANPSSASTSTSLTTHWKSLFMEQMGDKDIVKRAFKAFQNNFNQLRSSNDEKPHGLKQVLNKGSEQKTSTSVISQKDNDRARKTAEKINAQCYQPRRRLSSISTGSLNEGSLNDRFEKAASSSVSLRSDNRVERQKEFFKRSEVKANSNEADKRHLNSKSKEDKEAEIRKLKQSLTFIAKPMPDFYRVQGMSKNPSEKIVLLRNE